MVDPILADASGFDAAVRYIDDAIFGKLADEVEQLLGDPAIEPSVRMLTLFDSSLPVDDAHSFVGQHGGSNLLIARRTAIDDFLGANAVVADVVYAVSAS